MDCLSTPYRLCAHADKSLHAEGSSYKQLQMLELLLIPVFLIKQ